MNRSVEDVDTAVKVNVLPLIQFPLSGEKLFVVLLKTVLPFNASTRAVCVTGVPCCVVSR